ncbi:hypothetical protein RJG79_08050 [Mycoplasmatota bacterium WC44]
MIDISTENYMILGIILILFVWTISRYVSRIKGVYKFSFNGLYKEVINTFIHLGTKHVVYSDKDKIKRG